MSKNNSLEIRAIELSELALSRDEAERTSWLHTVCAGDSELENRVSALLRAEFQAAKFLDQPLTDINIGNIVGPFTLLEQIGQGGMGSVYRAKRTKNDFEMEVAIKLIASPMPSKSIIERFHRERRILAQLIHPNIARLLDGGTTKNNLPYVAMELVVGLPIDQYINQHQLSASQVLKIFYKVCIAVNVAHQNLVVHRDIKPGNILVESLGEPKLLDFGIAKLVDESTDRSYTQTGMFAFTPAYASPEQVLGQALATSSDVYSLGVVLYELFAKQLPYEITSNTRAEAERVITKTNPPSLVTVIPKSVARGKVALKELEIVILKAMAKDPTRRYASAQDFAEDIQNLLTYRPISARRESFSYLLGRFIRRHRVATFAALVVSASLMTTLVVSLQQTQQARAQTLRAERVSGFFQDLLLSPNTQWDSPMGIGPDVRMVDVVKAASKRLNTELVEYPEIQAELLMVLGRTYDGLGEDANAVDLLQRANAIVKKSVGIDSPLRYQIPYYLGRSLTAAFRVDEAVRVLALAQSEEIRINGQPTEFTAYVLNDYALALLFAGNYAHARDLLLEGIGLFTGLVGSSNHPALAVGYANLGVTYTGLGEMRLAETALEQSLAIYSALAPAEFEHRATALSNMADVHMWLGEYQKAQRELDQSHKILQKIAPQHPDLVSILSDYAFLLIEADDRVKAKQILARAADIAALRLEPNHRYLGNYYRAVGRLAHVEGRLLEAKQAIAHASSIISSSKKINRLFLANIQSDLADILVQLGEIEQARTILVTNLGLLKGNFPDQHPQIGRINAQLEKLGE